MGRKNAAQPATLPEPLRAERERRAREHATMTGLAVHPYAILAFWALARCSCVAGLEVRARNGTAVRGRPPVVVDLALRRSTARTAAEPCRSSVVLL